MLPSVRIGVLGCVLAGAAVGSWLMVTSSDASTTPQVTSTLASAPTAPARIVSGEELTILAGDVSHPVYWLGDRAGRSPEWSVGPDSAVIIRYLPGNPMEDRTGPVLSVATYPTSDASEVLELAGQRPGALSDVLPGGSPATTISAQATNAYFAAPEQQVVVEVFSPVPGRAYELIRTGQLEQVPTS